MSRQVVNPAISVISALCAPCSAAWPGVVVSSSSSQCTPVLGQVRVQVDEPGQERRARPGRSPARPQGSPRRRPPPRSARRGSARPLAPSARRRVRRSSRAARTATSGSAGVCALKRAAAAASARRCFMTVLIIRACRSAPPSTSARLRWRESLNYRDWSGYYAVSSYETHHEHEYNAIRNASALIDVSPLFKYRVSGRDAVRLVDRVITRDATQAGGRTGLLHALVRRARQGDRRRDGDAAGGGRRSAGPPPIRACAG